MRQSSGKGKVLTSTHACMCMHTYMRMRDLTHIHCAGTIVITRFIPTACRCHTLRSCKQEGTQPIPSLPHSSLLPLFSEALSSLNSHFLPLSSLSSLPPFSHHAHAVQVTRDAARDGFCGNTRKSVRKQVHTCSLGEWQKYRGVWRNRGVWRKYRGVWRKHRGVW
jgi:hypothetical protein